MGALFYCLIEFAKAILFKSVAFVILLKQLS